LFKDEFTLRPPYLSETVPCSPRQHSPRPGTYTHKWRHSSNEFYPRYDNCLPPIHNALCFHGHCK